MRRLLFANILCIFYTSIAQDFHLKYDLTNMSIDSCARIVKALSKNYGDKNLKSDTLYFYVENPQYNLYQDSLALYYLTSLDKEFKSKEKTFQKESETYFTKTNNDLEPLIEMKVHKANLADYMRKGYGIIVPVSYDSFDQVITFDSSDLKNCRSYNRDRIRVYNYTYRSEFTGTVIFRTAYHKTIIPKDFETITFGDGGRMPRVTFYDKPKVKIKPSRNSELIWKKRTGLSYDVAINLGLSDSPMKMSKILYRMDKVKPFELNSILDTTVMQEVIFKITCDTCMLRIYDHAKEDNDHIRVEYNNDELFNDTITNTQQNLSVMVNQHKSVVTIEALSEGDIESCTAIIVFNTNEFLMTLTKGKTCKIVLLKD